MGLFGSIWSGVKSVVSVGSKIAPTVAATALGGPGAGATVAGLTGLVGGRPKPRPTPVFSQSDATRPPAQSQSALDMLSKRVSTILASAGETVGRAAAEPIGAKAGEAGAKTLLPWLIGGGVALATLIGLVGVVALRK